MGNPIFLANQSITANNPAAAISTSGIPSSRQGVRLTVTVDNTAGAVDVSLTAPGAVAHSPYRVPVGEIGRIVLGWLQPSGSPYANGISLFAASAQAVTVGLAWE